MTGLYIYEKIRSIAWHPEVTTNDIPKGMQTSL